MYCPQLHEHKILCTDNLTVIETTILHTENYLIKSLIAKLNVPVIIVYASKL